MTQEKPTAFIYAGQPIDSLSKNVDHKTLEAEVTRLLDLASMGAPHALLAGGR
jgi:hypothetical protein